jgi:hypothetical protein
MPVAALLHAAAFLFIYFVYICPAIELVLMCG